MGVRTSPVVLYSVGIMTDGAGSIDGGPLGTIGNMPAVPSVTGAVFFETVILKDAGPVMTPIAERICGQAFERLINRFVPLPDQRTVQGTVRTPGSGPSN